MDLTKILNMKNLVIFLLLFVSLSVNASQILSRSYSISREEYYPYHNNKMWYIILINNNTHKLDTNSARTENELNDKMNWEEYDDNNNNIELILICGTIILFFMLLFWTINKLN